MGKSYLSDEHEAERIPLAEPELQTQTRTTITKKGRER